MLQFGANGFSSIGVHLDDVVPLQDRSGKLFLPLSPGRKSNQEVLAQTVDRLNQRYRKRIIRFGVHQEHPGFFERE